MDDHFTITIEDDNGIKQFNVHKLLKRFMIYGVLLISTIILFGLGTSLYLYTNVNKIETSYNKLQEKNKLLAKDIEKKELNLSIKKTQLAELTSSLNEIETLIGISNDENITIQKRVNLTKLSTENMATLLQLIPSGMPIVYQGITSPYGLRNHPILKREEFHPGIDFRAKMRTPVYATADGIVEWAGFHKKSGYGNLVILRHGYGFKSYYGHLNKVLVNYKEYVKKGDLIAYTGNSGLSSGPHLHYELRFLYKTINPYYFTKWSIDNFQEIFEKEKEVPWSSLVSAINNIKVTKPTKIVHLTYKEEETKRHKK